MKSKRIGITVVAIIELLIILFICMAYINNDELQHEETFITSEESQDKSCKISFYEYGVTYPLGSTRVNIYVSKKNETLLYMTIDVHNEGAATKDSFDIQWMEDYAIINVKQSQAPDIAYRVYWEDVFGERTKNN